MKHAMEPDIVKTFAKKDATEIQSASMIVNLVSITKTDALFASQLPPAKKKIRIVRNVPISRKTTSAFSSPSMQGIMKSVNDASQMELLRNGQKRTLISVMVA